MAETLFLRDLAGQPCGPGNRRALTTAQGSSANTVSLDATGDTWNKFLSATTTVSYTVGTWSAQLYMRALVFGSQAKVVLARYTSGCSLAETIVDETLPIATSGSFGLYTFGRPLTVRVIFAAGERLMCIVTEVSGDVIMQYNQAGFGNVSVVVTPDEQVGRPWYSYANQ